jgi:hypothetical protein
MFLSPSYRHQHTPEADGPIQFQPLQVLLDRPKSVLHSETENK